MMADNVNDLYVDLLYKLRDAPIQESRNGRVKALTEPVLFSMNYPMERVLFNPVRKCNPYLHVMETVWMFAGGWSVDFLLPFSKQMEAYAEETGLINGAYGFRWRRYFNRDQIMGVIKELEHNPDSRQAVIAMYDPEQDYQDHWKDRPCNTHIYFRKLNGRLDMTVCNRSNDVVWGACGANAVHMTYLQELVASGLRCPVGRYFVMSNNLHIYEPHWHMLKHPLSYDYYEGSSGLRPMPLMGPNETDVWEFMHECELFLKYKDECYYKSTWLRDVAVPMYNHYMCRLNGDKDTYDLEETKAEDWRRAEALWKLWKEDSSDN